MSDRIDQGLRDILRGAGVVYIGLLVQSGISFLAQVLAARYLDPSGFGGITTGTALLNVGSIIGSLGMAEGLIRYLPRMSDERKPRIVSESILIALIASISISALVVFNANWIASQVFSDAGLASNLVIFGAGIPFATLLFVAIGGVRGIKRARYRVYVENILHPLLRFLLIALGIIFGLGQVGLASAYVLPYIASAGFACYFLYRALFERTPKESGSLVLRNLRTISLPGGMFRYSLPFVVTSMSSFIYRSSDIFILLYFSTRETVGIYGIAYASARLVLLFSSALNFLGAPVASELEAKDGTEAVLDVHRSAVRWVTITSIPILIPFVVFAPEFIGFVYESEYLPGSAALAILALGFAVHNLFAVQTNILRAVGSSKRLATVNGVAATANVGLNFFLIPEYGMVGAAVATVLSYFLMDGLLFVLVYTQMGAVPVSLQVLSPIPVAIPLFGLTLLVKGWLGGSILLLFIVTLGFTALYVPLVLATTGLDEKEVMLIRSIQERFGIKTKLVDKLIESFS